MGASCEQEGCNGTGGLANGVAGLGISGRGDDAEFRGVGAGGEHHAFGDAEAHLAGLEVGEDHDKFAVEHRGVGVRSADAREDVARAEWAEAECELEQLVGAFNGRSVFDTCDTHVGRSEGRRGAPVPGRSRDDPRRCCRLRSTPPAVPGRPR